MPHIAILPYQAEMRRLGMLEKVPPVISGSRRIWVGWQPFLFIAGKLLMGATIPKHWHIVSFKKTRWQMVTAFRE